MMRAELLIHELPDIAAALGIPSDREWTEEEGRRIDAEAQRRHPNSAGYWGPRPVRAK